MQLYCMCTHYSWTGLPTVCLYIVTAGSLAWSQFFSSWGPSWQTWQPRRSSSPQIPLHQSHIHYSSLWLSEYECAEHQCLVFDYLLLPQSLDRMELETKFLAAKQMQLHALTNWRSGVWEPSYVRPKSSHFLTDSDLFPTISWTSKLRLCVYI